MTRTASNQADQPHTAQAGNPQDFRIGALPELSGTLSRCQGRVLSDIVSQFFLSIIKTVFFDTFSSMLLGGRMLRVNITSVAQLRF